MVRGNQEAGLNPRVPPVGLTPYSSYGTLTLGGAAGGAGEEDQGLLGRVHGGQGPGPQAGRQAAQPELLGDSETSCPVGRTARV